MIAILFNVLAVLVGSAIGALAKRGITEKYITVLNTAMGLAALVLGVNVAMSNMNKSHFPALFIFCLALGGLLGTVLRLDERMQEATRRVSKNGSNLTEGITTGVLFCCVGTLSMMGPVLAALKGDNTYLMTAATLNLVTMIVVASSYGFWVCITGLFVFLWQGGIYGIAKLSAGAHFAETFGALVTGQMRETEGPGTGDPIEHYMKEINEKTGVLIAAAGLGVMNIKDCKTINLLPALLMPMLYFLCSHLLGF